MLKKILIVDDELVNRDLLSELFSEEDDKKLFLAENAADALEIIKVNPPDIILLDIMMPQMSGLELCKLIRGLDIDKKIYIYLMSGDVRDEVKSEGFNNGADAFIEKPFSLKAIYDQIINLS